MVGLHFEIFLDLERGDTTVAASKLNWKRVLHGIKIPHRVFQCPQCDNDKICEQCKVSPKMNCFECEVAKTFNIWLNKLTQMR